MTAGAGRPRVALTVILAVVLAAAVVLLARIGSGHDAHAAPDAGAGVQAGPAPWAPEYAHLAQRLDALGLPPTSDAGFHIHLYLRIWLDGRPVPVPSQLGIDPGGRFLAPLHTHDASGIVHVESVRPYPFTLGEVFRIWGVRFTDTTLGSYGPQGARRLRVYVDGRRVADPVAHVLQAHEHVVVGYGTPGSFPTIDRTPFPPGL
jgi:hypothetical protein